MSYFVAWNLGEKQKEREVHDKVQFLRIQNK